MNRALAAMSAFLLLSVMASSPSDAATSVVRDPAGDVGSAAPYMDVVHARVVEQQANGTLLFMMKLAGDIPNEPSETDLVWPFHVDTIPGALAGTPALYNEYVVRLRWINGVFVGQVVDRTGAAPAVIPVTFEIDGRKLKVFVPLNSLGDPSTFGWNASTRPGLAPSVSYVDFAPDGGSALATWTS